jgi:tRNA(Ile)-lysidine synthase
MKDWGGAATGLEQRLLARYRDVGIPRDGPLVVAFSGGPDSLALAAALTHVRAVTGLPLLLVHVDHRLRDTSGEDAAAAAELGRQLGIDAVARRVPVTPREAHPNLGVEEAARRERYRLLSEEARRVGAGYIATGHHREDQAETVLLHLLRGSGLHGAAGMAEVAPVPVADSSDISHEAEASSLRLWRPYLGESRSEILGYLNQRGLTPILDPSNTDVALRRNALRHRALPELESAFPGAAAALARFAALAAEEDLLLESIMERALPLLLVAGGGMKLAALREEPRALQRRLLRRWLVETTGETTIGAERVEAVLRWAITKDAVGTIELTGGWCVRRGGEWLIVERNDQMRDGEGLRK